MGFIDAADRLLFGPPLPYKKRSAYGLEESMERIRALFQAQWKTTYGLGGGLTGAVGLPSVTVGRVRYMRWDATGCPVFRGNFQADGDGVALVGSIAFTTKAKYSWLATLPMYIFILFAFFWYTRGLGAEPPAAAFVFVVALWAISLPISRYFHEPDFADIADALDRALS